MEIFRDTPPMELSEFKNLGPHGPTTYIDIPEKLENRVPTDKPFLYAFIGCIIFLMPFLITTLAYSDIRRISGEHDDCGNICGVKNDKYDKWNCTGKDFTDKKYLTIETIEDEDIPIYGSYTETAKCVDDCYLGRGTKDANGKCIPDNSIEKTVKLADIWSYLGRTSVILRLICCSIMAVGVSVLALYVFRFAVGCVIWTYIIGLFVMGIIMVATMWFTVSDTGFGLTLCIIFTIALPLYAYFVYLRREKIALVIVILTEASNAVFALPSLIFDPLLIWLMETTILILMLTTNLYMSTAGDLVEKSPGHLEYVRTDSTGFAMFFNVLVALWGLLFVNGLENMIVAGAVSEWYFAKDKTQLNHSVRKSAIIAYKCHLGTVAFGSLIILITGLIRYIIRLLKKSRTLRYCLDHCFAVVQGVLVYLTNNAYIITAMHGQPFLKSGKRAASLVIHNFGKAVSVRLIGRMTLVISKLIVGIITVLLSTLIFMGDDSEVDLSQVYFLIIVEAVYVASTFFALLETAMDTIFICFCEDLQLNDGISRPYAMSQELMEFVDNIKKVYGVSNETQHFEATNPEPV